MQPRRRSIRSPEVLEQLLRWHVTDNEITMQKAAGRAVWLGLRQILSANRVYRYAGVSADRLRRLTEGSQKRLAALAGLSDAERVTIPSLQDGEKWTRFEAARKELSALLSNATPAPRYRPVQSRA